MNRNKLLQAVRAADFYVNELNLYLDTHPEDQKAICLYNEAVKKSKQLRSQYEQMYGPLTINFENQSNSYEWIREPWPWEGDCNVEL